MSAEDIIELFRQHRSPDELRQVFADHDTFARHMGMEFAEISPELAVVTMPFDDRHKNSLRNAHGGALFSLADLAFAVASCAAGFLCVNAQTSISYLAPGTAGPLRAEARPIHLGHRVVTYEVKIFDGKQVHVAQAIFTGYGKSLTD